MVSILAYHGSVCQNNTPSGKAIYDKIKVDFKLFGKWEFTNSIVNINYTYEIYKRGTSLIGVILQWDYTIENLEKRGYNYYVKGSDTGVYYKIDSNMNMSFFDQDGELASMGYKITKL